MKGGAAASTAPPLVDEFLERLRVEDGSRPLTIAAYRRDLGVWSSSSAPDGERSRPRGADDLVAHSRRAPDRGTSAALAITGPEPRGDPGLLPILRPGAASRGRTRGARSRVPGGPPLPKR